MNYPRIQHRRYELIVSTSLINDNISVHNAIADWSKENPNYGATILVASGYWKGVYEQGLLISSDLPATPEAKLAWLELVESVAKALPNESFGWQTMQEVQAHLTNFANLRKVENNEAQNTEA